jgi:hypothetical protein
VTHPGGPRHTVRERPGRAFMAHPDTLYVLAAAYDEPADAIEDY